MKKILSMFLTICIICSILVFIPMVTNAVTSGTSGIYGYTISDGEAIITRCATSASGDITIPSTLESCPVTSVGKNAFSRCSNLTSIEIPNSVTSVGKNAFSCCSNLTSIEIPNSVTSIGSGAFCECDNLTNITIPNGVTSIEGFMFQGCDNLTSITIPNSVTSIEACAFCECDNLTNITISSSVTSIGFNVFGGCSSLPSITVEDGNINYCSDEYGVLYNKDKTTLIQYPEGSRRPSFTIPNSVTSIESYAFDECDNLTNFAVEDGNINYCSDEYGVLYNKDKTTLIQYPKGNSRPSFTIPSSVTSIDSGAFYECDNLTNITIPNGVTSIEDFMFQGCDNLTSITIPNSVTSIGYNVFDGCKNLTNVYYYGSGEEWDQIAIDSGNYLLTNGTIHFLPNMDILSEKYRINSITIKDMSGKALEEIPNETFLATVSITNVNADKDTVVILAQYSSMGVFKGLMYVNMEDVPVGSTVKLTLPIDNTNGNVEKLKSFCWDSFASMEPLGNAAVFPVE